MAAAAAAKNNSRGVGACVCGRRGECAATVVGKCVGVDVFVCVFMAPAAVC